MRKRQAKKRPILPDPKFNDQLVTRFVNMMMWDGKKSIAFKIFYDAIAIVDEKNTDEEKTALQIWKDALSNVMPHVEVRSRRVGGATFQIPMQIRPDRKISTAMKTDALLFGTVFFQFGKHLRRLFGYLKDEKLRY